MNWNSTTKFLLPTVLQTSEGKEYPISGLSKMGFVNAYVDDYGLIHSSFDWYKDTTKKFIYLLFTVKNKKDFTSQEEIIKKFPNWIDYYDLDDDKIMHVLEVPRVNLRDVDRFLTGKFSEFSDNLKKKYTNSFTKGIVYKLETARQEMSRFYDFEIPAGAEYMSIPDVSKEVFRFEEADTK